MKKRCLITLPLIALALIGCNKTATSSSGPISSSTPASSESSSSAKASSSSSKKENVSSSTAASSSSSAEEVSSSSSDDVYSKGWSRDITDLMLKHLGGTILPKINLGSSSLISGEWSLEFDYTYGRLIIDSAETWDSTKTASECAKAYTADGNWDVTSNVSDKFEAYTKDKKVHVIIAGDTENDNDIQITATYDEDYDIKKATTAWDSDIQSDMTGLFGEVTEYVYLGLAYPTSEVSLSSSTGDCLQIFGGKWTDTILTDAMSWADKGFSVSINANSKQIVATKASSDGKHYYTYTVDKYGVASIGEKIRLTIRKGEIFNPDGVTAAWTDTIKACFTSNLNGHENDIPYIYLGAEDPSYSYDDTSKQIKIIGNTWDDSILTTAESTYTSASGWEGGINHDDDTFSAQRTFSDCDCVIKIEISHRVVSSTYDYPMMTITIEKGLYIPSDATDWTASTKSVLNEYMPGLDLPYVYLNLKTSADDTGVTETAIANGSDVIITGGEYIEKIKDNMKASFAADVDSKGNAKWTVKEKVITPYLSFEHVNDDGSVYQVNLTKTADADSGKTLAQVEVKLYAAYSAAAGTDYSDDLKTEIANDLHKHELPYVYLYTASEGYYWYGNQNTLQIWGGKFFKGMITAAESSFSAKGWTTKVADDGNSITATIEEEDGCALSMYLHDDDGTPLMEVVYTEPYFDKANQPTAWNTTTTNLMSSKFKVGTTSEEITFPYVYLGTTSEASDYSSTSFTITLTGQVWSSQIIEDAKTTYSADGWATYDATYDGKAALIMSKAGVKGTTKTGNNFIILIYRMNGKPIMKIKNEKTALKDGSKYNPVSTASDWTDAIKAEIKTNNGNNEDVPYIDLGSDTIETDDTNDGFFRLKADVNFSWITRKLKAYDALVAHDNTDGVTNKYNPTISITNGTNISISGTYQREDGSSTTIQISGNASNSYLDIYYSPKFTPSGSSWTDKTTKVFKKYFDGNVIPYFYLGSDDPSVEVSNDGYEIILTGETWSDSIYDYAIEAFDNDKDATTGLSNWGYSYDYSDSSKGKQLVAYTEVSAGTYITCKLYRNSIGLPVLECYYVD